MAEESSMSERTPHPLERTGPETRPTFLPPFIDYQLRRPQEVPPLTDAMPEFCSIWLATNDYAPTHRVTLRTSIRGEHHDIVGEYGQGANNSGQWTFKLHGEEVPDSMDVLFVLDGSQRNAEGWITLRTTDLNGGGWYLAAGQVTFPGAAPRPKINYPGFRIAQSYRAQYEFKSNYREDVLHDVIVIGSGFGGATVANVLSRAGRDVLMLELGGVQHHRNVQDSPRSNEWERESVDAAFSSKAGHGFSSELWFNLGGRSVLWSAVIPRMLEQEYQHWPRFIEDYLRQGGYTAAEKLLNKSTQAGAYQESLENKIRNSQQLAGFTVQGLPMADHPGKNEDRDTTYERPLGLYNTADLLLRKMHPPKGPSGAANLAINLHHLVQRIEPGRAGSPALVHCLDVWSGDSRVYKAKRVVLAAGTIQSARIAMQSNLGPADRLGRGLMDHPNFNQTLPLAGHGKVCLPNQHAKIQIIPRGYGAGVPPYYFELNVNKGLFFFRPSNPPQKPAPEDYSLFIKAMIGAPLSPTTNGIDGQPLNDRVGIRFKNHNPDEFVQARAEIQWNRDRILEAMGYPIGNLGDMDFSGYGSPQHCVGTLWMSDNRSGVVNTDLRFDEHPDIYCADSSVFPYNPSCNPTLTMVALALRAAERIHQSLP